jgi:hypothetical protein
VISQAARPELVKGEPSCSRFDKLTASGHCANTTGVTAGFALSTVHGIIDAHQAAMALAHSSKSENATLTKVAEGIV